VTPSIKGFASISENEGHGFSYAKDEIHDNSLVFNPEKQEDNFQGKDPNISVID
jgi:hypothetical protein